MSEEPTPQAPEIAYKKAAEQLAKRVIWALKFMKPISPGGCVINPKTGETHDWEEWFMDALDTCGYQLDRDAFYKSREEAEANKRKRKPKKAR